jgi:hypothetical protein
MKHVKQIVIDVADWSDEAKQSEEAPKTIDDLVQLAVKENWPTAKLWRVYCILREMGIAESDELPPNKAVFQNGGTMAVNMAFKALEQECELANGRVIKTRTFVGPVVTEVEQDNGHTYEMTAGKDDGFDSWQEVGTPGALDNAIAYVERRLPGYIRGRLEIIAASNGDVKRAADFLHDKIDEIVKQLT